MKESITGNAELIRKINKGLITRAIIESGSISRTALTKKLGLALPTVMRIVDSLLEDGIVLEVGQGRSSGGRKPKLLQLNSECMYFIGACIQRKLKVVLSDAGGAIIHRYEIIGNYDNMSENILDQIVDGIESIIKSSGIPREKVACAGIGTPGFLFKHTPLVENYPFANWAQFDVGIWNHSGKLPCPVRFENIPKLGALAEMRFGYGRSVKDFVYIYADFGIGAGIVTDGKLYMGAAGVAGEFGHTTLERNGVECYCGNHGCVEMYASSVAVVEGLRERMQKEKTELTRRCAPDELNFGHVLEALRQNDRLTCQAFERAGRALGLGLANLINLFNPELVIIGGELSNCKNYVETAKRVALDGIFLHRANNVQIVTSAQGEDDLLKGAISLAMGSVFETVSI